MFFCCIFNMSLFEQQLEIIREFDNGNYNVQIYKDFLNNSKSDKDYKRNVSMLLELIKIKILSSIRIENIRNVFRLYLDLFIKNNKYNIREKDNKDGHFLKCYLVSDVKTCYFMFPVRILSENEQLNNNSEIQIGVLKDISNFNRVSIIVNNIEAFKNFDLDNLIISVCEYNNKWNKVDSILNTYINDEKVKELKNILLNDDLDKFVEFLNKNNIISNEHNKTYNLCNKFYKYNYSILYDCIILSAVKCFIYLYANNYIADYNCYDIDKSVAISGNISIFNLIYKHLDEDHLGTLISVIIKYHKNNLFEYILSNHYEDIIKHININLYSNLIDYYNFNMILKLVNNEFNTKYDYSCDRRLYYIVLYIYNKFGLLINGNRSGVLYNILYDDLTISEYKEILYNISTDVFINNDKLILSCFKYNKSSEFIKELIKECEITEKTCKYFNEPLKLIDDLINKAFYSDIRYKLHDIIETFDKVFSHNQIFETDKCYFYFKNIIYNCFLHRFRNVDIKSVIMYFKREKGLTETEINDMKPVKMLYNLVKNSWYYGDFEKEHFERFGDIFFDRVKIYYDENEIKLFTRILNNSFPYKNNINKSSLLKIYKKYVNCLTFKE